MSAQLIIRPVGLSGLVETVGQRRERQDTASGREKTCGVIVEIGFGQQKEFTPIRRKPLCCIMPETGLEPALP